MPVDFQPIVCWRLQYTPSETNGRHDARLILFFDTDDMGFKTGLLISPDDLRELVLPGHKKMAAMAHAAGRPYLLHSCGKLDMILDDLIDDVKIDAKHSFEDNYLAMLDEGRRYRV